MTVEASMEARVEAETVVVVKEVAMAAVATAAAKVARPTPRRHSNGQRDPS